MPVLPIRNVVKEKLAQDQVVSTFAVRLVQAPAVAALAAGCGFDNLFVDLEHSPLSLETAAGICIAALRAGVTPFVRVPTVGPEFVSRMLDAGALGIIAPHVASAKEAAAVVELCRFPPLGKRSEGGPMPHYGFCNPPQVESHRILDEATTVIVMIESSEGLEHVDEIAAVPGVDMLFIGSNDLCGDLGITGNYDHPLLRDAYARTIAACRRHGKQTGVGGLADRPDLIAEMVRMGGRYVSLGSDVSFLLSGATAAAKIMAGLGV